MGESSEGSSLNFFQAFSAKSWFQYFFQFIENALLNPDWFRSK